MRITEETLLKRAMEFLPKAVPAEAIQSVEVDDWGNSDRADGISYWVYLSDGFRAEKGRGCHTIHEDTLSELKKALRDVVAEEE